MSTDRPDIPQKEPPKNKASTARPAHTYRTARRNRARRLGLIWRLLPREKVRTGSRKNWTVQHIVQVPLDART